MIRTDLPEVRDRLAIAVKAHRQNLNGHVASVSDARQGAHPHKANARTIPVRESVVVRYLPDVVGDLIATASAPHVLVVDSVHHARTVLASAHRPARHRSLVQPGRDGLALPPGLSGRSTESWTVNPVKVSHGWYDVTVTSSADAAWSQRFVGPLETGKPSITG